MHALQRKPVVRESEVFTALFPRAFSPPQQHDTDKLPLLRDGGDEIRGGSTAVDASAAGRPIPKLSALSPKTPRSLMTSLPMTASDCTAVWTFLCDWVKAQIAMEAPATIPGLGTVSLRTQALKIRIPFFDPDRVFLDKHGLTTESTPHPVQPSSAITSPKSANAKGQAPQSQCVDVLSFSFLEMAACCGKHVEPARAKEWLQTLLQKMGEALRQCQRVEFDLGVGVVVCSNGVVESHMLPRHTSTPSKIPFEIRTGESVVKRSLQIPSSPSSALKSSTFLAGAQFSPAIRLHPAIQNDGQATSALFTLETPSSLRLKPKQSPRSLMAVLPGSSTSAVGASPRTLRLRNQSHGDAQEPLSSPRNSDTVVSNPVYAPLFDSVSRTFCVEPDLNLSFLQPSNRIAANYTPAAAGLLMAKSSTHTPTGASRYSGYGAAVGLTFTQDKLPCDSPYPDEGKVAARKAIDRDALGESRHEAASEERYFAYLHESNHLMDEAWLAPLDPDLVERIMASAVKYLNETPTGHMKAVLDAAQDEFVSNYNVSVKKAILDYLLLRNAARMRLGIVSGTPSHTALPRRWQWGDSKSVNGCMQDLQILAASSLHHHDHRPTSPQARTGKSGGAQPRPPVESSLVIKKRRRKRVKTRLLASFMLANPQIRALHYLWYDFEATLLLVKLPDVEQLSEGASPMDLHAFERAQLAHASQLKAQLMDQWYNRAKQVFEQAVARSQREMAYTSGEVARLKHLFDAVAAQMSLQIRSLILKSIRAYLEFFELFGSTPKRCEDAERDATQGAVGTTSNYSALLISLTLQENTIQFKTPLVEIPSMLLGVLHNLPQLFHNMNRIEKHFESQLASLFSAAATASNNETSYSPFLWNVSSQEDEIVVATMRIREIIEQNLTQLHELQAEYATYGATFRHISTMTAFEEQFAGWDESNCEDEIEQWHRELQRVRDVACSLVTSTRPCRQLNLFSVDCHHVNNALLTAYAKWTHRLLSAFADRTAGFNAQLRQQYKDVAARLAKRPLDLYDLVEAEDFVELLKTSKLQELQVKVEGIKHRMQFLLFRREDVHIDAPEPVAGAKVMPSFQVPNELLASTAKTIRWRTHIERLLQDAESSLVGERSRIEAVFLAKRNRFQAEIEEFDAEVKSFSKKGDLRHAATYVVQLSKMKDALVGFKRQMESVAEEEAKLQWKPTDFSKLDDIAEEMEPYEQLWKTAREFRELNSKWLRTNVFELQAHEGPQALQLMIATISNVSNLLHLNSAAAAITAEMVKKQMSDFRENTRLVAAILNPSVQDRHLKEMSSLVGLTIDPQEPITLLKLLENGAYDHLARIVDISENATMEKQIEDALRFIDSAWQGVQIQFKTGNSSSEPKISGGTGSDAAPLSLVKSSVEDVKLLVEDHQLRLQTLQCLPHAVPFFQEIARWLAFLHDVFQIVDLMVVNERLWKRLVPLFAAQIIEDTADECQLFGQADRQHRSAVVRVANQSVCLELVTRSLNSTGVYSGMAPQQKERDHLELMSDLSSTQNLLERVRDSVSVGFELRRVQFPRFFLLSDTELVAVLASCTAKASRQSGSSEQYTGSDGDKNAKSAVSSPQLWRYLQLCFPGVRRVLVNANSPQQELTAFISPHGEQVPIGTPIATASVPIATWLGKLETAMTTILQACTRAAISDFARKEFRKWCLLWPEQVLCITIIHAWTMQGEINNRKPTLSETRLGWQAEVQALNAKADAVTRELKAAGAPSMRLTLSNVILVLHQLRDVSAKIVDEFAAVADSFPSSLSEEDNSLLEIPDGSSPPPLPSTSPAQDDHVRETMTWLAQPRMYYDSNATLGVKVLSFAAIPYGFEYNGNASPVVSVTPLTLRCFHTLVLHAGMLHKGSHVYGPGSSGKKTTCGMVARQCGRLFIHFETQDHAVDQRFHAMIQFLKVAVACGAWMMMTDVHCVPHGAQNLSLLASICSQVIECQTAKMSQCTVLATKLKMKKGFHFIVVSPSRRAPSTEESCAEMDEYLRSCFRPVELQVHDLNTLTEFFLQQAKMMHTNELARLINAVTQALGRGMELLMHGERSDHANELRGKLTGVQALRDIASRAAALCAHERTVTCTAHGWPPQAPSVQAAATSTISSLPSQGASNKDMPPDLVREIERIEHRAVCVALREFVGAFAPAQAMELIDSVLRDFATHSRELRTTRSFLLPSTSGTTQRGNSNRASEIESMLTKAQHRGVKATPEDTIEKVLRTIGADSAEKWPLAIDTDEFCLKARQLYLAVQSHRAVVVVGDIQTGKTTLWRVLAEAMSQLHGEEANEAVRRDIQTVVIHPRAMTLHQLFDCSPHNAVAAASNPLIAQLARDAKARMASNEQKTWLVLDGDICESWAGRILQATEERSDENVCKDVRETGSYETRKSHSRLPGLLLPSTGKRLVLPSTLSVIMETTALKDISPGFLANVGVVHVGDLASPGGGGMPGATAKYEWRGVYRIWKAHHRTTFEVLRDELYTLLDTLLDEVLNASLQFVATHFDQEKRFHSYSSSASRRSLFMAWRVRSFLALLHSFLWQSWSKLSTMVSGKQRKTAIHCYFLQALVWGVGHTSDTSERNGFHTFLRQWIIQGPHSADSSLKRVLVLFFPSGTMGSAATGMQGLGLGLGMSATQRSLDLTGGGGAAMNRETLYSFGFSVELGSKWMRWGDLYDAWLTDRCQLGGDAGMGLSKLAGRRRGSMISANVEDSRGESLSGVDGGSSSRSDSLFVRTSNTAAALFLLYQLMASGYPALLCAPRDAGKTTCGRAWLDLYSLLIQLQSNADTGTSAQVTDSSSGEKDDPTESVHMYTGVSVTAQQMLEQLDTFVEQKRIRRRRRHHETNQATKAAASITASTLVFIDDLHCMRSDRTEDCPLELVRGIVEYQQVVHPTAHSLMKLGTSLAPFAAVHDANGGCGLDRGFHRLVTRFVPIAMSASTDAELSTICSTFVSCRSVAGGPGAATPGMDHLNLTDTMGYSDAAQETSHLVSMLIKATIKMYRVLTSGHWTASHHIHSASSAARAYAATIAFQPAKAHYLFHVQDILHVLRSVCCDTKQPLAMAEKPQIAKLWCHETARVFGDRLCDENDSVLFYQLLSDVVSSHFNLTPDALVPGDVAATMVSSSSSSSSGAGHGNGNGMKNHVQALWLRDKLFFSFIGESSGAGMVDGYREVHELQKVELSIERTMMAMYRSNVVTESLPFVLCTHAMRHIMRLTRVLRHSNDDTAHFVLIGRRGSKMRTLTRLAAFICCKSTTTFYTSRTHTQDLTEWTQFFKTALLQSVRQHREDRLVVIVKDAWLVNLEIYASLDRFLSGGKRLSNVISYEDFDESILQTLREEAERDRRGDASVDTPVLHMHSKSSVVEYFFTLVRRKLQFVVVLSIPSGSRDGSPISSAPSFKIMQLMAHCPHLQKNCTFNYFGEWPEESLYTIAQKCLAPTFAMEKDRLVQLSQVAVQIYQRTRIAWAAWSQGELLLEVEPDNNKAKPRTSSDGDPPLAGLRNKTKNSILAVRDRPSGFIQIDPSMLIEQIVLFLAHLPHLQRDVEANKTKYAAGLAFMERTEQILALEQSHQQMLQPEMDKKTAVTRRMSGNLEKEKLTSNKLHRELEMATSLVDSQRTRLAQVESEYDELIRQTREIFEERTASMKPFVVGMQGTQHELQHGERTGDGQQDAVSDTQAGDDDKLRKELVSSRLHRSMVHSFIATQQPATSLRQLAECIGLIFGIDPVEARDELDPEEIVMDYWGTTTQRMQHVAFWQELVAFDVRARMSETIVARVLPICMSPDFDKSTFASIHDVAVLLCEWVQACAAYARDSVLAEPKYAQLCHERVAYDTAIAQLRTRQVEIQAQTMTTSTVNAMRTLSEQERREIEEKLKGTASTLQMTTSVWKVLEPGKAAWKKLYEYYTQFGVQAMGDLMLATATMVYAGSTTSVIRSRLRALWSGTLNQHYVMHSPVNAIRPLHKVFLVDDRTLTKWQIDSLPCQDAASLESAVMATQSFLFPVLIDPHHVASAWLKRQCEYGMDHVASDTSSRVGKTAMESGIAVVSGAAANTAAMWDAITQSIKKKQPVIVEDFNESQALELLSLLQSKRRSRFDVVNRDLSSVTGGGSIGGIGGATAGAGSQGGGLAGSMMLMRRTSSVGIGLGISASGMSGASHGLSSTTAYGVNGNHRCWFEVPPQQHAQGKQASDPSIVECGSESCRVYFMYTQSETIPEWLASLASQVAFVRFEFSLAQIRSKSLRVILDAQGSGHSQVLTEIQTLQVDMISCDEQIETIENEILDFFSVEDPVVVYGDTAKALKIVGNRSSLHTLVNSKLDASKKIQQHYIRLAGTSVLVRRCMDLVATWRDVSAMWNGVSSAPIVSCDMTTPFCVEWLWTSLTQALRLCAPSIANVASVSTLNHVGYLTALARQCVKAAYASTEMPVLFDLLLCLRVHGRRQRRSQRNRLSGEETVQDNNADVINDGADDDDELHGLLPRLVQLLECKDDAQSRTLCASVASKLLVARPGDSIPTHKWRALCFLAEKLPPLRELILASAPQQQSGGSGGSGKDTWKDALALDQLLLATNSLHWSPTLEIDALTRLCLVAALQKSVFWCEVDAFVAHELAWSPSAVQPPESTHDDSSSLPASTPVDSADTKLTKGQSDPVQDTSEPESSIATKSSLAGHSFENLWRLYSSAQTPIHVICQPETEFLREVQEVAVLAKATLDLSTHESHSDEAFEQSLRLAIQKGLWVALPHVDTNPRWLAILTRLVSTMHTLEPHPDFRVWVSSIKPLQSTMGQAMLTAVRFIKRNEFPFHAALRHAWTVLDQLFFQRAPQQSRPAKQQEARSRRSPEITRLLLRVGVLHALLSCRDQLVDSPWMARGVAFSDDALVALGGTVLAHETEQADLWAFTRALALQTYGSLLHSHHEQSLLACCVDLVLSRTNQSNEESVVMSAALRAIPEVAHVLRLLDDSKISTTSALLIHVDATSRGSLIPANGVFGPLVRYDRAQRVVGALRHVLEYQGLLTGRAASMMATTSQTPPPRAAASRSQAGTLVSASPLVQATSFALDALSRFATELEGHDFDEQQIHETYPCDYKRPLNELLQYEIAQLRATRRGLINIITALLEVSNANKTPTHEACDQFASLLRGETPLSWYHFVGFNPSRNEDAAQVALSFESFQLTVLERMRFIQSWVDHGVPVHLAIDKFHSSVECVFETIHQHLARNLVGNMHCGGAHQCVRIMRLLEDRPQILLPVRDETMYLSGWRVHGHLQLEIVSAALAEQPRKRSHTSKTPTDTSVSSESSLRFEGTPVVVEITTTCLASQKPTSASVGAATAMSGSLRQLPLMSAGTSSNASSRRSSIATQLNDFACPIQHSSSEPNSDGASLIVSSILPIAQLVLSGSRLSVNSLAASDHNGDRRSDPA